MSRQTKSFVTLLLVSAVFVGMLFYFTKNTAKPQPVLTQADAPSPKTSKEPETKLEANEAAPTDVAKWEDYTDQSSKLSFKYPSNWKVSNHKATDPDLNIIVIDPGNEQDHFRIYIADDGYFAIDGLKKDKTKIGGQEAWTVQDILFGVKDKSVYFTFDLGGNLNLKPTFQALMSTVAFGQ